MTPERRAELRAIVRAHAFDAAFRETSTLNALALAWTNTRTRDESRCIVRMFVHYYPRYARRSARALVRRTHREVSR